MNYPMSFTLNKSESRKWNKSRNHYFLENFVFKYNSLNILTDGRFYVYLIYYVLHIVK